MIHCSKK